MGSFRGTKESRLPVNEVSRRQPRSAVELCEPLRHPATEGLASCPQCPAVVARQVQV